MTVCWLFAAVVVFLSAPGSVNSVTPGTLATIENYIVRAYNPGRGMFSVAACMPNPDARGQNLNAALRQVTDGDARNAVLNSYNNNNQVYTGRRVVAAKAGPAHAEYRVLAHLAEMTGCNANDFLFFYVYAAPCVERCLGEDGRQGSILTRVTALRGYAGYAFVFSRTFVANSGFTNPPEERRRGLMRLGASIGLPNIYRCDLVSGRVQCTSCSNGGQVTDYCVN